MSAYENNPYAFYDVPRDQPRVSRKMRVKTPNMATTKQQRRSNNNMELIPHPIVEKQPRPTTAVGVEKKDFVTPKGRRILSSAKPGQRRKLRNKKIMNMYDKDDEYATQPVASNGFMAFADDGLHEFSHKFSEDAPIVKYQVNANRPPSRQKEPSLALGIGSEYGEDLD